VIIVYKSHFINSAFIVQSTQHSFKKLKDETIAGGYLQLKYHTDYMNMDESMVNKIPFKDKKEMNAVMTLIYEGYLNNEPLVDLNTIMGVKE
jgi:hypothetical protein